MPFRDRQPDPLAPVVEAVESAIPASSGACIVGIGGAVAVGKTTIANALASALRDGGRTAEVVGTDGFLHPNAVLASRGLLDRKGFPESYDTDALEAFVGQARSPVVASLLVPVYSHAVYDVVASEARTIERPDVLVLEGVNALAPVPRARAKSLLDLAVYVDADEQHVIGWFVERFLALRAAAADAQQSFYARFLAMTDSEAESVARAVWDLVNGPNLRQHIAPTIAFADLVIRKGPDHRLLSVSSAARRALDGTSG